MGISVRTADIYRCVSLGKYTQWKPRRYELVPAPYSGRDSVYHSDNDLSGCLRVCCIGSLDRPSFVSNLPQKCGVQLSESNLKTRSKEGKHL